MHEVSQMTATQQSKERGFLSKVEKYCQQKVNLCFYCRKPGHILANFFNKSTNNIAVAIALAFNS